MAKKLGKIKPTKNSEEETSTTILNSSLIDLTSSSIKSEKSLVNSNSTNIIIKETTNPSSNSINNGNLSATKTSMSNLSIKDKSTIKENLCKEEIVEGFAFLTFLSYSDLEVSFFFEFFFEFFIFIKIDF